MRRSSRSTWTRFAMAAPPPSTRDSPWVRCTSEVAEGALIAGFKGGPPLSRQNPVVVRGQPRPLWQWQCDSRALHPSECPAYKRNEAGTV